LEKNKIEEALQTERKATEKVESNLIVLQRNKVK
jgi:hypothetical protein